MLVAPFHASHFHTFPRVTKMYTILGTVLGVIDLFDQCVLLYICSALNVLGRGCCLSVNYCAV